MTITEARRRRTTCCGRSRENEHTVGFVYYDEEAEDWRYGWSVDQSVPLGVVRPEEAVDVALDRIADELAGR